MMHITTLDTKTIKLLIKLNKIQKLNVIVKSNDFYFCEFGKGAGMPYRCVPLQKSTVRHESRCHH